MSPLGLRLEQLSLEIVVSLIGIVVALKPGLGVGRVSVTSVVRLEVVIGLESSVS